MLLAPLDIVKLPHTWFLGIVSVLVPGLVFFGVVGYLRWDLVTAFQNTPVFSESVRIAILLLMAAVSGLLINILLALPILIFYFIGYIPGYLHFRQTAKRDSRNMLWRRIATRFLGDQVVRLEEPSLSKEDFKEKLVKSIPAGTQRDKIIEILCQAAALQLQQGQLDEEWAQMYQVLESYFHPPSQDNLAIIGLVQGVGLAVACALVLCRTPNQSLLIIVAVVAIVGSCVLLVLLGFADGHANAGDIFQLPKILREMKSVTKPEVSK